MGAIDILFPAPPQVHSQILKQVSNKHLISMNVVYNLKHQPTCICSHTAAHLLTEFFCGANGGNLVKIQNEVTSHSVQQD